MAVFFLAHRRILHLLSFCCTGIVFKHALADWNGSCIQPFRLPFVSSMRLAFGQFQRCSCPEKSASETRSDSAANWSLSVFPFMPCKSDAACQPLSNMTRMVCVLFLRHSCCKKATVSPAIRYFIGTASACILAHRSPVLVFCCEIP